MGVSAGVGFTCAIDMHLHLMCFGNNLKGQVKDRHFFTDILKTGARDLSCGAEHCCSIGTMNDVFCWGSNETDQVRVSFKERRGS